MVGGPPVCSPQCCSTHTQTHTCTHTHTHAHTHTYTGAHTRRHTHAHAHALARPCRLSIENVFLVHVNAYNILPLRMPTYPCTEGFQAIVRSLSGILLMLKRTRICAMATRCRVRRTTLSFLEWAGRWTSCAHGGCPASAALLPVLLVHPSLVWQHNAPMCSSQAHGPEHGGVERLFSPHAPGHLLALGQAPLCASLSLIQHAIACT